MGRRWQRGANLSGNVMVAGLRLPAGALVTGIELEGCDDSATFEVRFSLFRRPSPGGPNASVTPIGATGGPATPGCGKFPLAVLPALTIDNDGNTYAIRLVTTAPDALTRFTAVRVFYHLQVSQ